MEEPSLEKLPAKEPDLKRLIGELQQAQSDINFYLERIEHCRHFWHNISTGKQYYDGRKHAEGEQDIVTPWEGSSDSRLRIVDTIIDQHVTLAKTAFWSARIQCKSERPLVYGRENNIAQKMLEWRIYTQMRSELLRELPLAYAWKYGFGLSFISVEWEQQRTMLYEPLTMETMVQLTQELNAPEMDITGQSDDAVLDFLQSLSEILDRDEAKKILSDLRNEGIAQLPVVNVAVNKPKWEALMPCIDILIPSEANNIQSERWVDRRELVTETELEDRIATDDYDPDFVEEAVKHKGEFSEFVSMTQWRYTSTGSERDLIELHHFFYKSVESGIPCIYRTVFNEACAGKELFAVHKAFEYQHQQYPLVALRRTYDHRPLFTSTGIAEEAYTDELDIKVQQDGLSNRTELIHNPPMIVPVLRAQGVKNMYGPRAVMASLRPNDVNFPPLPPSDNTPMLVIEMVTQRLKDRYFGLDPVFQAMRLKEIGQDVLGEMELVVEQTLQLMQQFETDADVQRVAGKSGTPFNVSARDIQGRFEISITYDMKLADMEYVKDRMQLYQQAMQFNQAGSANMSKLMQRIMSIVDPDAEDIIEEDQQSVTERERSEEKAAAAQIMVGIEPDKPQHGNHSLRLQTLIENTVQSKNQAIQQTIMQRKDIQDLLKNRVEFFQNQIQQFQKNPEIGRSLSTQTFSPKEPAQMQQ